MARTSSHVYSKDEIKKNAKLIQETFSRLGEKVKITHAHEAAAVLAGYKDWSTANALSKNNDRALTVVIGAPGSGKTTYIHNTVDLCNDTLIVDYRGEITRDKQPFEDAMVMPLKNKRDADLIIKILPMFSMVVMEESSLIYQYYPDLFANILYSNISTIITAQNKRVLESAGLVFKNEPEELLWTTGSQMIAIYTFDNPHIGRKEFESFEPWQTLQSNITYNQNAREINLAQRDLNITKVANLLQDTYFTTPLAIVGQEGVGKGLIIQDIVQNSNIYSTYFNYLVTTTNINEVVIELESMPDLESTFFYFDMSADESFESLVAVIINARTRGVGICFGFQSEEAFKMARNCLKFSGVIRTNGKTLNYSDSSGTKVFGYDFGQAGGGLIFSGEGGTGSTAMRKRMEEWRKEASEVPNRLPWDDTDTK